LTASAGPGLAALIGATGDAVMRVAVIRMPTSVGRRCNHRTLRVARIPDLLNRTSSGYRVGIIHSRQ
jgi:hypothetical protein